MSAPEKRLQRLIDALKLLFLAGCITERERARIERSILKRAWHLGYELKVTR